MSSLRSLLVPAPSSLVHSAPLLAPFVAEVTVLEPSRPSSLRALPGMHHFAFRVAHGVVVNAPITPSMLPKSWPNSVPAFDGVAQVVKPVLLPSLPASFAVVSKHLHAA